ncbi:carbonic anhydrase [Sandarakinorhabdus sp. DWP1-3-1]|uniref:carbonic anhydrase n=1 Tax=Sandarakinorhabdus sp. DWP1-3-1 TaxID=2804627 RepID=UPI003CF3E8D4
MAGFDDLIAGYRRFRGGAYVEQRQRYDALAAAGQKPRVMIIACSDSRVDPSRVFDSGPGEVFVVRNVANLVPPYETDRGYHSASAAIEFAVTQLEVEELVVLGHAQCGGITASLTGKFDGAEHGAGAFIDHWMDMIEPARDAALKAAAAHPDVDAQEVLELAAIRLSLANLRSFPFVAAREAAGTLTLRGAHFGIADGALRVLDPATDRFVPVSTGLSH